MFRKRRTYLDFAAGASGNPSSPHAEGRAMRERLEAARKTIARLVEAKSDDVLFTSGATEANALAILGLVRPGTHLLYLPSAHASIVENMRLAEARGARIEPLPVRDGRVALDLLRPLVTDDTALVSMDAVCGETGVLWNTREVRRLLDTLRPLGAPRILLHVDASQAPLTEKCTRSHFGADLLTLDASKVSPVRGIGCLVAHRTIALAPLYAGGGQERGLRPGSESPELAEAFAAGLVRAARTRPAFRTAALGARKALIDAITEGVPNVYINEGRNQAPHILSLSLPGRDTDYLVTLLDEAGFSVATRSACETGSVTPSRAVFALTGDAERSRSTLRISWGPGVSSRALLRFVRTLREAVAFVDRGGTP